MTILYGIMQKAVTLRAEFIQYVPMPAGIIKGKI